MKQRIGWKQRLLSAVLAAAMCAAMLPAQPAAFAEDGAGSTGSGASGAGTQTSGSALQPGDGLQNSSGTGGASSGGSSLPPSSAASGAESGDMGANSGPSGSTPTEPQGDAQSADVIISWVPVKAAVPAGEEGAVHLEARLGEAASKAHVDIKLTAQEAEALRQFRDGEGRLVDGDTLESSGGGVEITLELSDDGGAMLSFTLDKAGNKAELQHTFTFQVPNGVSAPFRISVGDDISVESDENPNPVLSMQVQAMNITAEYRGWQAAVEGPQAELQPEADGALPDFTFAFSASALTGEGENGVIYTKEQKALLSLALPEGVSLPEGEPEYENNAVTIGGRPVAALDGLPEGAVVTPTLENGVLALAVTRTAAQPQSAEMGNMRLSLAFTGAAFTVAPGFEGGRLALGGTLENVPAAGEAPAPQQLEAAGAQVLPSQQGGASTGENEEQVIVTEHHKGFSQRVYWIDNNNEASNRPQENVYAGLFQLKFRLDGGEWAVLTEENMAQAGLEAMPGILVDTTGVGSYTLTVNGNTLPVSYTHVDAWGGETTHTVEWQFSQPAVEGYAGVDVNEGNADKYPSVNPENTGWYYVLLTDFAVDVELRWGTLGEAPGITDAILEHFQFNIGTSKTNSSVNLSSMKDHITLKPDEEQADPNNPTSGKLIVEGIWKFNLDGSQNTYSISEQEGVTKGQLVSENLTDGDYFEISYDNSAAPNFGSVTDKLHGGGTLYLTLKGEKAYNAHKVWLDEGAQAGAKSQRPTGEVQLWRYRKGENPGTAAPVRNADGTIVTKLLQTDQDEQEILFGSLEKYDAEGYEYLYVTREYLDATTADNEAARSYEQVFGEVDPATGSIQDRIEQSGELTDVTYPAGEERPAGNTFLYNGGTLSNRITDAVEVTAAKVWKASAFQAHFEDVSVMLTLQSRVKGTGEWKETGVTETMDDFFAENLTVSVRRSMPKYDANGAELEYRWVEAAVYQGADGANRFIPDTAGGGTFTLQQAGREVEYRSELAVQTLNPGGEAGGGETEFSSVVTNSIANTIRYDVEKVWLDETGNVIEEPETKTIVFDIYQSIDGAGWGEPVASFEMDGIADEAPTLVNGQLGIYAQETAPWKAAVSPLAEFDADGGQYEYFLLEQGAVPTYETTRGEEGYYTRVTNGPGKNNRILVRKEWVDDSDITHREPVTIGIYAREDGHDGEREIKKDEKINEITLENGVWSGWAGIGGLEPEDVYILETSVGDTPVPLSDYRLGQEAEGGAAPNYDRPAAPAEYNGGPAQQEYTAVQYETVNHNYEVTYGRENVAGVLCYTATNRRFGNINFTVSKTWVDGAGELRAEIAGALAGGEAAGYSLAMQLEFAEQKDGYAISYGETGGDYVTVGSRGDKVPIVDKDGRPVNARQPVDLTGEQEDYCFYGLPKYDLNGNVVQYTVREVWLDADGKVVENENELPGGLKNLLKDYRADYGEAQYQVSGHEEPDIQQQEVTNRLTAVKNITWDKVWKDTAVYQAHQRPDIYLDIYQVKHTQAGEPYHSLYQANYKWVYVDEPSEGTSLSEYWIAELNGLPKYDEYGYEIFYYAVEKTTVNAASFDYQPVQYSVGEHGSLTGIGTELEVQEAALEKQDVWDISGTEEGGSQARYALKEGGTFTNTIAGNVKVQGQKLWASLPTGYPQADLPIVTFQLMRTLKTEGGSQEPVRVATLTVSDWASIYQNGSYLFCLEYEGENIMTVQDGKIEVTPEDENAERLPKYDEEGRQYEYTLKETSVAWPEGVGAAEDSGLVYADPEINTYLVENRYDSEKGATAVKKLLELPMDEKGQPEAYPAVRFVLKRYYTDNTGSYTQPVIVQYHTWDSKDVETAYEAAKAGNSAAGTAAAPLEKIFKFENLDVYAPNGSRFIYFVEEEKAYLGGYDTWGDWGDKDAAELKEEATRLNDTTSDTGSVVAALPQQDGQGLALTLGGQEGPAVAATFLNAPGAERETVKLSGEKLWNDYNNLFQTRPGELTLTVSRYADAQPGQGNAIGKTELPESSYRVVWDEESKQTDVWAYSIEGAQEGELERYAPNGMPWKYEVKEILPGGSVYSALPGNGTVGEQQCIEASGMLSIVMNRLTNTIRTSVPYEKNWVDSEGNIITEDYLGLDLAVTFQLQVIEAGGKGGKPAEGETWEAADDYFERMLSEENYEAIFGSYNFTSTKQGRINDSAVWGQKYFFERLPSFIPNDGGGFTYLCYRVVETGIEYGGKTQAITVVEENAANDTYRYEFESGLFSPAYWADGKDQPGTDYNSFKTQVMYNRLETTGFSVAKQWRGDSGNAYGTRPETARPRYDWEVSFVIQRSADGGAGWENVTVYDAGAEADLTLTLYGTDGQSYVSSRVAGLPAAGENGAEYQYRARELQTGWQQRVSNGRVAAQDILDADAIYHTAYTVTYEDADTAVNTLRPTRVYAEKLWNPGVKEPQPVTFALEYLAETGTDTWTKLVEVTVDGQMDEKPALPYYEYEAWKAVWAGLPEAMPGSDLSQDGKTQYRVTEKLPAGCIQQASEEAVIQKDGASYVLFRYTNVESAALAVQKVWHGTPLNRQKDVVVGLWRTTGSTEAGERVAEDKFSEAASEAGQYTLTLTKAGGWKGSFTGLPKYDGDGRAYTYYAREISVNGQSVKDTGFPFAVSYDGDTPGKTTVTNTLLIDISGTKSWNDGGNAYSVRPAEIELTLWRSTEGGPPQRVENAAPVWENTNSNIWKYTYYKLPAADEQGGKYTYTVEETPVPGYEARQTGYDLTNTLTVDIPVTKLWSDSENAHGQRPGSIVVALYANGTETARVRLSAQGGELLAPGPGEGEAQTGEETGGAVPSPGLWQRIVRSLAGESAEWSYTFTGLPQYDEKGSFITYTVKELALPDGYGEVLYGGSAQEGFTIENVALGGLRVKKTVEGAAGDKNREFHFTVTLSDASVSGTYGGMTFEQGAASFTLRHGQSAEALGLPGGITYEVAEQEANADGYVTTHRGESGTVPAGSTAEAEFVNRKDPPGGGIVKTGSGARPLLYAGLLAASLAGMAGVLAWQKKRRNAPPTRK